MPIIAFEAMERNHFNIVLYHHKNFRFATTDPAKMKEFCSSGSKAGNTNGKLIFRLNNIQQ